MKFLNTLGKHMVNLTGIKNQEGPFFVKTENKLK